MNIWEGMSRFMGKIRPQIMVSIVILGTIAYYGIEKELTEITVGCIAGIIALAKDVLQSDAD
jgi:hypothetical protein|tara:strand:- start:4429 stop:4614 length:186 start_codon:yes stop_codon:yes gene_type:complete